MLKLIFIHCSIQSFLLHFELDFLATHRRNINAKLGIHSSAGLTIYAIIHNIIDYIDFSYSLFEVGILVHIKVVPIF